MRRNVVRYDRGCKGRWGRVTSTELCKMCTEYSIHSKCEYRKSCKLQEILEKNKKLRAENKELREKVKKLETDKQWTDFPDMMGK